MLSLPALCRLTIHQNGPFSASLTGLICVCEHCMEIVNCRGTNYFQFPTCQLCGSAILCFQDGNTRRAKDARCIESTFRYSHQAIPQSGSGTRRRIPDFEERELHFTGRNEKTICLAGQNEISGEVVGDRCWRREFKGDVFC